MAGMQYYFFPTDFYYPKPSPPHDTSHVQNPQVLDLPTVEKTDAAVPKNVVIKLVPALTISHVPSRKPASTSIVPYK